MVNLILDTSFIIYVTNSSIIGFDECQHSLGITETIILKAVEYELGSISQKSSNIRSKAAKKALGYASKLKKVSYNEGKEVDDKILNYAKSTDSIVATLDLDLKKRLRAAGVPVIFMQGNRLVTSGV
jgi:rRNA-processing protein FCF1